MTIVGQFDSLDEHEKIKKLRVEIKDLRKVNKSHQKLVGNLYKEIDLLKKDMAILKESNQALNMESGRMMQKLSIKDS